ncbi:MAG: reprolysin-like metallopeptidase [Saprospiraceae bacterium]
MFEKLLTLLCALMVVGASHAQSVWSDTPESGIPTAGERRIQPAKFRAVRLNVSALQPVLAAAPERFSTAAESGNWPVLSLPLPDGGMGRFQIEETPVMHPDLQAKYPQIRTYTGRGIDDPTAVLKCDLTPWGFHGMVRSVKYGTYFIDPAVHGNTEFYVVYNKKDYLPTADDALWTCASPEPDGAQVLEHGKPLTPAQLAEFQGDTKLRRYRLALACTGEYATFHGGTKPLVLAAMNTSMNRVNGVYETDFAVTMQIIANNDLIIYLNGATDPYTNGDGGAMLGQNQVTCNNVIGIANYDIGHVFSTGGGGVAGLYVVCGTSKANGVTGGGSPVGDPFDIDYVAHEIGHQFGGSHTYGNCGSNVNNPAAVEPGSGTTIMAYAGICGAQDVAAHSEDIFHGYNILEMGAFIYTGGANTCPVKITTTNHNPDVNGGPNRIIPKSTPFALTAVGTDIDGDTLSYTWEQMDFGNAPSPPVSTATVGPLFRSYKGNTSPTRYFPRLPDLVNNVNSTWEELPGVARNMSFRVVARDNDWYAGCTDEDDVQITVAGTAGPFLVTAPNTNVLWLVGETKTVTWDVANTTAAPVSCANVRITLSTDGGFTYPVELAASVPNNGSANITVPNNVSATCRVRVESVGNIFFDISNANFRIETPPTPTYLIGTSVSSLTICAGSNGSFNSTLTPIAGFNSAVTLSVTGAPAGSTVDISPNPVMPTGSATISISGITAGMAGNYTLTITGMGGAVTQTATVALTVLPGVPGTANAISPTNGQSGLSTTAILTWSAASFGNAYLLEVATNPSFSAGSIVSSQTVSGTSGTVGNLLISSVYYWRIRASNDCGTGSYSATWAFQTGSNLCGQNFNSTDVPKIINASTVNTVFSNLNIGQNKVINDVNMSVAITHTYTGDLLASLVSPTGDTTLLFDQPGVPASPFGCNGQNVNLTFDSQAAQNADALENQCNGTPPSLNGTFQSIETLNAHNGKSAMGDWKLVVTDNYNEDGGPITAWSLSFCFPEVIAAGNILVNSPLSVGSGLSDAIFQSHLVMETTGIPGQGVFILLSLPQHGALTLNGTPLGLGDSFTQADINNNLLVYTNNGDAATADDFHFDALDQNNNAWVHDAIFNINIIPNNLAATASETSGILCHNDATGEITVAATGLNGTYTYSLNGGASQSSNVFSGLPAGTYTVVVTGQFGFTVASNPVTIANPTAISVNASVSNDDITVNASGGTGLLEYSINGVAFQSSNEFLDLSNDVYTVTVRDENGCTATTQATVAVNNLVVSADVQNEVSCNGGSDGEIVVMVSGGQLPYEYSINGGAGQSSNVFSNLAPGSYTVVVTDNAGFSASSIQIILANPSAITVTAVAITNDIVVTASGGTSPLEYSINGTSFQASNQFNNVANGTYTVTVRDANGCMKTTMVTVNVPALTLSVAVVHLLCFGNTNGSITATASGGIPFYAYSLNGGVFQGPSTFNNLPAGTYTVTVKDFEGNEVTLQNIVINQPPLLNVTVTVTGRDGFPGLSGGTPPYSFASDAPNPDLQNLPNGTYHVTATDANGCTAITTFTINVPLLGGSVSAINLLCNGDNSGLVMVIGFGGIPPYQYSLIGGPFQSNGNFNNLSAGAYVVTIRDADGFEFLLTGILLVEPQVLALVATVNSNEITATASGGTPNYQYSLNGGAPQSSGTFSNLASGSYTVVATDANGCTASVTNLVIMTGTIEPTEAWGLAVSPNPSTGLFVLTLQNAPDALHAEVFDAIGRLLQSIDLQPVSGQLTTTLNLQDLPQGTYLLRLSDGQNWGSVRLSKVGGR